MNEKELVKCKVCNSNPKFSLRNLQKICFNQVSDKGFYEKWNNARNAIKWYYLHDSITFEKQEYLVDLAEMALMETEISEAEEEIRNGDREKAVTELAGCVIRILCYCENQNIDLQSKLLSELERNESRPKYHGRTVI